MSLFLAEDIAEHRLRSQCFELLDHYSSDLLQFGNLTQFLFVG